MVTIALRDAAFAPGGGGQPAGKRGRVADIVQLIHELEPDALGVVGVQPMTAADGPGQRGLPVRQRVPGLPIAVPGPGYQAGDHWVIAPAAGLLVRAGSAAMAFSFLVWR